MSRESHYPTLCGTLHLSGMIWSVPELIADLSRYYHLGPGNPIYTGTPAGVGPVVPGNMVLGEIDGLTPLHLTITEGSDDRLSCYTAGPGRSCTKRGRITGIVVIDSIAVVRNMNSGPPKL